MDSLYQNIGSLYSCIRLATPLQLLILQGFFWLSCITLERLGYPITEVEEFHDMFLAFFSKVFYDYGLRVLPSAILSFMRRYLKVTDLAL